MLIVAQPKSASTSLLSSLRTITGRTLSRQQCYSENQRLRERFANPPGFPCLRRIHSDVANYDSELIEKWIREPVFYKQHVVPTPHNLSLLCKRRFVVLLRSPDASCEAYWRSLPAMKSSRRRRKRRQFLKNEREAIFQELEVFHERYQVFEGDVLRISFEELTQEPQATVQRVLDFFAVDVSVPSHFSLAEKRYSPATGSLHQWNARLREKTVPLLKASAKLRLLACQFWGKLRGPLSERSEDSKT